MDTLDRLGWAAGSAVDAYGVRLGVRVTDPGALAAVAGALPPGSRPAEDPRVDHLLSWVTAGSVTSRGRTRRSDVLYRGSRRVVRTTDRGALIQAMEAEFRRIVAEHSPRFVFVHAGVVEWQGRAIVIPGRSFSGKTTMVAELLRAGAAYCSDEYAVLDRDGSVHPFVKPLSLRDGSARGADVVPAAFGARIGRAPIRVGAIVVTTYAAGAVDTYRPQQRSGALGALALLDNAVAARSRPGDVLHALAEASRGALVLEGPRGEARPAAEAILAAVDRSTDEPAHAGGRADRSARAGSR
jgi:hypothetical protein